MNPNSLHPDDPSDPPLDDPLPDPEPSVPSLDQPDPGVFHHNPVNPDEPAR